MYGNKGSTSDKVMLNSDASGVMNTHAISDVTASAIKVTLNDKTNLTIENKKEKNSLKSHG